MSDAAAIALPLPRSRLTSAAAGVAIKLFYAVISGAKYWLLIALAAMLFCPPDLNSFPMDRLAFHVLVASVALRLLLRQNHFRAYSATWPMLGLLLLGLLGVAAQSYDAQAWSVLAAKWIVPVAMFHIAAMLFSSHADLRKLEWFSITVVLYLAAIASFDLLDFKSLIFPRFILDESIGIHADRARGPFLQAVANGVSITVLALVALHSYARGRLRGVAAGLLFLLVPLALMATKTRAVWLSAGTCVMALLLPGMERRVRMVATWLILLAAAGTFAALLLQADPQNFKERLRDRSPVEFRMEMYRIGAQMFAEKPLAGWGSNREIQPEVEKRISGFRADYFIFHNTFLELGVQRGILGLALYTWLMICFLRLGKKNRHAARAQGSFLDPQFRPFWILIVCVYLLNACVVVMSYQFLNSYIFTIAGIMSARQERSRIAGPCELV